MLSEALNFLVATKHIVCESEKGAWLADCEGGVDCLSTTSLLFDQGVALKRGRGSTIVCLWKEISQSLCLDRRVVLKRGEHNWLGYNFGRIEVLRPLVLVCEEGSIMRGR